MAEAYAAFLADEQWWLTDEEEVMAGREVAMRENTTWDGYCRSPSGKSRGLPWSAFCARSSVPAGEDGEKGARQGGCER